MCWLSRHFSEVSRMLSIFPWYSSALSCPVSFSISPIDFFCSWPLSSICPSLLRCTASSDRLALYAHGYISVLMSSLPYLVSLGSSRFSSLPWTGKVWLHSILPSISFSMEWVGFCIFSSVWTHLSDIRTSCHSARIHLVSHAASSMVSRLCM